MTALYCVVFSILTASSVTDCHDKDPECPSLTQLCRYIELINRTCPESCGTCKDTTTRTTPEEATNKTRKVVAWCFGYGSLVSSFADKAKFVNVQMPFRRVWNAWNTKARATFLGLEPSENNTMHTINGIIYPIYSQEEMDDLILREQGYAKRDIDKKDVAVLNEGINNEMLAMKVDDSAQLFTFVPEAAGNAPNAMFPVLMTYVDLCAGGFLKFRKEGQIRNDTMNLDPVRAFLDTTHNWSERMLNDRVVARRPWKHEDNSFVVDDYLDDEDDVNDIPAALYPVDYSVIYHDELKAGLAAIGHNRLKYVASTNAEFFGM